VRRAPVASSSIRDIGYDPVAQRLEVGFRTGGVYQYDAVPSEVHDAFIHASSKGRFFQRQIRDRYRYRRIG
jgi:hypothetical protein